MTFPLLDPGSDLHVHSVWSDGESTLEENVASANGIGMHTLGLVDHVWKSTEWVPGFVEAVRALDGTGGLEVLCGVEAKLLDTSGDVDVPDDVLPLLDYVLVADHQVPTPDGPRSPRVTRELLEAGELDAGRVLEEIVEATVRSLDVHERVIVAHLFSVLPKVGLDEADVPDALLQHLAVAAGKRDVTVEINEKWKCPSPRVAVALAKQGVPITLSTDAHHESCVGRYDYVAGVAERLTALDVAEV
jgi:putative hydrolase